MMYGLTRYNNRNFFDPFREMEQMTRSFFGNDPSPMFSMDIKDTGDAYQLMADLPGMKKEDIQLDLDGDRLTITAQRKNETEESDESSGYIRRERSYGSYTRTMDVSAVDTSAITASYTDGVLTLNMPKKQPEVPTSRRLEIQ